jgi:6-pyruvoyltetrahydropterin/6-carboxytetrahydropterin synthase
MYEVEKTFSFEAGHILDHHDGKCRQPHGHSYVMKIKLRTNQLDPSGPKKNMVIDFTSISLIVKPMIEHYFDHKWLNDSLETDAPTAEFIAHWTYHYLEPLLPNLYSVTISETNTSNATYAHTQ